MGNQNDERPSGAGANLPVTGPVSTPRPGTRENPHPERSERFPEPVLASAAMAKAASLPAEDLTVILTCGDAGGMFQNEDGEWEACDNPSSFGIPYTKPGIVPGKCFHHTDQALGKKAKKRALFLSEYIENPGAGVAAACLAAGVGQQVVYYWKRADKEFGETFEAIREIAREIVDDNIEDAAIRRLLDETKPADTLRQWWLINRRNGKWRNPNKPQPGDSGYGGGAGASFSGGQHVHVWQVGDRKITF